MSEVILEAKNITRSYFEGRIRTDVLKGVNLAIRQDELTAIIGKSGSGKSTLLHILGTLDTPTSGEILFKGDDLCRLSGNKKAQFRNQNLGFVYQYLEKVGLSHRIGYRPSEMSGGERQRVAIARALAGHPDIVLADEPTGNLDAKNAQAVFSLFTELAKNEHLAVVMVTHDNSLAKMCDKIYTMKDGVIDEN